MNILHKQRSRTAACALHVQVTKRTLGMYMCSCSPYHSCIKGTGIDCDHVCNHSSHTAWVAQQVRGIYSMWGESELMSTAGLYVEDTTSPGVNSMLTCATLNQMPRVTHCRQQCLLLAPATLIICSCAHTWPQLTLTDRWW